MSKVYSLKTTQQIPISLEQAWDFFSKPENLVHITPPNMRFDIISQHHGNEMYAGQIIEYRLSPFRGISIYWMTEITHVQQHCSFVDEQRYGPFSLWHHQHHFKAIEGGVEMTDIIHYKVPCWLLGTLANSIMVRKRLRDIFQYRYQVISNRFGVLGEPSVRSINFY